MNFYIAQLVMEFRVEGDELSLVHRNYTLVAADDVDEAYRKSLDLGRSEEDDYTNPENKRVRCVFRGLAELSKVHEPLEHGSELMYTKHDDVTEEAIVKMVRPPSHFAANRELLANKEGQVAGADSFIE
jgi:hypothetical protein